MADAILDVVADLIRGGRHSRTTVARFGVSLPTADRWLKAIETKVPGVRRERVGRVSWLSWSPPYRVTPACRTCGGSGEAR